MHAYLPDSPQAAARIVALVMIADGHVSPTEFATLEDCGIDYELSLAPGELQCILHTLCDDLQANGTPGRPLIASVDNATLLLLLAEISDPALQRKVYCLAGAVAAADHELHSDETRLLEATRIQWSSAWAMAPRLVHSAVGLRVFP
jgi:hypothetical protein